MMPVKANRLTGFSYNSKKHQYSYLEGSALYESLHPQEIHVLFSTIMSHFCSLHINTLSYCEKLNSIFTIILKCIYHPTRFFYDAILPYSCIFSTTCFMILSIPAIIRSTSGLLSTDNRISRLDLAARISIYFS